MRRLLLVLILALAPLLTAVSAAAQADRLSPADSLYQHILQGEEARNEAYARHDTAYLHQALAEEFLHTNLRGGTTTKAEEIAFYASSDFSLDAGEIGDLTMHRYGDVIVLTGRNTWRGARFRNVDLSGDFRVTRVYVLRDGHWQVVASHASRIGG